MADKALNVITICGSLRKGSYNRMVMNLLPGWAAANLKISEAPPFSEFPLYNADVQNSSGFPAPVQTLADAIRAAERSVRNGFAHIAFVEPMDTWSAVPFGVSPAPGFSDDAQVIFAPHLYAGSITADRAAGVDVFPIPGEFDEAQREADRYQTTFWSGEWGWFGDPATDASKVAEYAAQEDSHLVGGAWWQWKQACGDPHSIGVPGGHGPSQTDSLVRLGCPSDTPLGIAEPFQRILGRAYPRAAPGRLQSLTSEPATGTLHLSGDAGSNPGPVDLWVPAFGGSPVVNGTNVTDIRVTPVSGGYRVTAMAGGSYELSVTR